MIDNIYVRFRSYLFRQAIPMGTHYSPLFLFLHPFEYDFILNTMKQDMTRAIWLSNTFRYMDDLFSVNNEESADNINTMYPSELELKDTSTSSNLSVLSRRTNRARVCTSKLDLANRYFGAFLKSTGSKFRFTLMHEIKVFSNS